MPNMSPTSQFSVSSVDESLVNEMMVGASRTVSETGRQDRSHFSHETNNMEIRYTDYHIHRERVLAVLEVGTATLPPMVLRILRVML